MNVSTNAFSQSTGMDVTSPLPLHMKQAHRAQVHKHHYDLQRNRIPPDFPAPVTCATTTSGASHLTSCVYAQQHLYR